MSGWNHLRRSEGGQRGLRRGLVFRHGCEKVMWQLFFGRLPSDDRQTPLECLSPPLKNVIRSVNQLEHMGYYLPLRVQGQK